MAASSVGSAVSAGISPPDSVFVRRGRQFACGVSALAIVVGASVLLGWALGFAAITAVIPGGATMRPNTALAFILAALSLLGRNASLSGGARKPWYALAAKLCAGLAMLIGLATLTEYVTGFDPGIDGLLFPGRLLATGLPHPGRMAPATAFGFCMLGASLLLIDVRTRRGHWPAQLLALMTILNGTLAIHGYLFGVEQLYRIRAYSAMALHTALLFNALGWATLLAYADRGWLAVVSSQRLGGALARRVLPWIILAPVIRWLLLVGQKVAGYGPAVGDAVYVTITAAAFGFLVWRGAKWLNREEGNRQRAEDALRDSENRFRSMYAHAAVGIEQVANDGRLLMVNAALCRMLGFTEAELLARSIVEIIHPDDRGLEAALVEPMLRGDRDHIAFDKRYLHSNGSPVWVNVTSSVVRDAARQPLYRISVIQDISERKRTEEALRTSEERLAAVIDTAMDAIVAADEEQRIVLFNGAAEQTFRCPAAEAIGRPLDRFLPERFRQSHRSHVWAFGASSAAGRSMNARGTQYGLRADGEEFPLEAFIFFYFMWWK